MICKSTWPNPRGSDRDGTQEILNDQRLDGDVTYGKTKIFIKSPETVFHLEQVRYVYDFQKCVFNICYIFLCQ